jgi:hypothetical protein
MRNYGVLISFPDLAVIFTWHGFWNEIKHSRFEKSVVESIWRNLISVIISEKKKFKFAFEVFFFIVEKFWRI